ncbi:molybdopterin-dependent oxidoreductase, partial [bacterium]|nr:molybdopterin-dependent oxidoreductase [bacterium]
GVGHGAKGVLPAASGDHLNVYRDGPVRLAVGGTEMGQGFLTVLCQIAADSLGAPIESTHVAHVDTSIVPDSGPSVASRTTLMTGNAVIDAATKLKVVMGEVAADMLGASSDGIEFRDGLVRGGNESGTVADAANECWPRNGNTAVEGGDAGPPSGVDENGSGDAHAVYSYATHVAEVEVDTETGETHLVRVTAAHDVGRILNPVTLEGQIEGGVLQGAGMGLYERMKTSGGDITTPDFSTYIIPTAMDVPEIESVFVEARYSMGPFGAKGIGETPAMPGAVAIANAVTHATGIRFNELPVTAEAVRLALSKRRDQ